MTWQAILISLALAAIPTIAAGIVPRGRFSRRATLDGIKTDLDIAERLVGTPEADWLRRFAQTRVRQYGLDATRKSHRRLGQSNQIALSYLTEPEKRPYPVVTASLGSVLLFSAVACFTSPRLLPFQLSFKSVAGTIGMAVALVFGLKLIYHGISRQFWPWMYLRADPVAQLYEELLVIDKKARPPHPESPGYIAHFDTYEYLLRR